MDRSLGQFAGDIYDTDGFSPNSRVAQFTPPFSSATTASGIFGEGTAFSGVAVDPPSGVVYALDSTDGRVDVFDPALGSTTTPVATFGAGTISPGDNARIWVDSSGRVFVPDGAANVVDVFTPSGPAWTVSTIGAGNLSGPNAVAVDSSGLVYVLDSGNARVVVFSSDGTLLGTLGSFSSPTALTVAPADDHVFVVDQPNGFPEIHEFTPSTGNSPKDFTAGTKVTTFGSQALAGGFANGIAVDSTGTVYFAIGGFFGEESTRVVIFTPAASPAATTGFCSSSTATTTTLFGSVNPNDPSETFSTTWYFEYGLSSSYGQSAPAPPPGVGSLLGNQAVSVNAELAGLQPNRIYHFHLVAVNSNGSSEGSDSTCATAAVAPALAGVSSSEITQEGAVISAQINPNNEATTYQFQYGLDINYTLGDVPSSPSSVGSAYGDQSESAILAGLRPNTLYHYRVVAVDATGATNGVDHTFTTLPNPPSASTDAASGVSQSTAMLNGTIDPQGAPTSYYFECSGPGVFSIISGQTGSSAGERRTTAPLTGLVPGSTYRYRLIATNAGGTTTGTYQSFSTAPSPPSSPPAVITGDTSNLTPSTATLDGTVNPNGGLTTYEFQYGTSLAYGASLSTASPATGTEPQGVAAGLSGLVPGTSYHYRLVATNANGTSYGADQAFTTPAASVSAFGPPPVDTIVSSTITRPKTLIRAQKLANALKACERKPKKQRAGCIKQARKKDGKAKRKSKQK
ncbi:MAG TPA: NHL repeat-containing protein [Solirubrobacteraceae bacterium]